MCVKESLYATADSVWNGISVDALQQSHILVQIPFPSNTRAACKVAVGKRIKLPITVAWENDDYNILLPINRMFCSQKAFVPRVSEAGANPSATEPS